MSRESLHQKILGEIEEKIVSGVWPPGHRLPFEVDLAVQYGCSRMTVNKVMTQLAKSGLIERRKKSGSFVTTPQGQAAVLEVHDIKAEVQALGLPYRFEIRSVSERRATAADRRRLEIAEGARLLDVTCLHHAGARPFCLEQRLIHLGALPDEARPDFSTLSPGAWLLAVIPWSAAEHAITAVSPSPQIASLLDIDRHAACLVVERRTWSGAGPVTQVIFTYPGDRHRLVARFTPQS